MTPKPQPPEKPEAISQEGVFLGFTRDPLCCDNSIANCVIINNGEKIYARQGDVVISLFNFAIFMWDGIKWHQIGPEDPTKTKQTRLTPHYIGETRDPSVFERSKVSCINLAANSKCHKVSAGDIVHVADNTKSLAAGKYFMFDGTEWTACDFVDDSMSKNCEITIEKPEPEKLYTGNYYTTINSSEKSDEIDVTNYCSRRDRAQEVARNVEQRIRELCPLVFFSGFTPAKIPPKEKKIQIADRFGALGFWMTPAEYSLVMSDDIIRDPSSCPDGKCKFFIYRSMGGWQLVDKSYYYPREGEGDSLFRLYPDNQNNNTHTPDMKTLDSEKIPTTRIAEIFIVTLIWFTFVLFMGFHVVLPIFFKESPSKQNNSSDTFAAIMESYDKELKCDGTTPPQPSHTNKTCSAVYSKKRLLMSLVLFGPANFDEYFKKLELQPKLTYWDWFNSKEQFSEDDPLFHSLCNIAVREGVMTELQLADFLDDGRVDTQATGGRLRKSLSLPGSNESVTLESNFWSFPKNSEPCDTLYPNTSECDFCITGIDCPFENGTRHPTTTFTVKIKNPVVAKHFAPDHISLHFSDDRINFAYCTRQNQYPITSIQKISDDSFIVTCPTPPKSDECYFRLCYHPYGDASLGTKFLTH